MSISNELCPKWNDQKMFLECIGVEWTIQKRKKRRRKDDGRKQMKSIAAVLKNEIVVHFITSTCEIIHMNNDTVAKH